MKLSEIQLWEDNPRKISDEAFEKLKQSLKNDLDFLKEDKIKLNRLNWRLIVYAWNQRVKALRELWYEELDDDYFTIAEISEAKMIERWLKDNEEYWEYDREKLSALLQKAKQEYDLDISNFDIPSTSIHKLNSLSNWFELPSFDDDLWAFSVWDWIEELEEENKKKKREQNYIIRTEIIFDDELQRETWNYFLSWLADNIWWETLAERLTNFINEKLPKLWNKKKN